MIERTTRPETEPRKQMKVKLPLVLYDVLIFVLTDLLLLVLYRGGKILSLAGVLQQSLVAFVCIFGVRYGEQIYRQIWRYGGIQCYIRLLLADGMAFVLYFALTRMLPVEEIAFVRQLAFSSMNLLGALAIRMVYRYAYKCGYQDNWKGKALRLILKVFSGGRVVTEADPDSQKIHQQAGRFLRGGKQRAAGVIAAVHGKGWRVRLRKLQADERRLVQTIG